MIFYLFTYLRLSIDIHKSIDKRKSVNKEEVVTLGYSHLEMSFCIFRCRPCFYINLHAVCELTCSNDFRDKQGVLKLMVVAQASIYHLRGNVISATVGLVDINLQPEYELLSSTRFGKFRKFGKIGVRTPSSQPPLRKNFLHRV